MSGPQGPDANPWQVSGTDQPATGAEQPYPAAPSWQQSDQPGGEPPAWAPPGTEMPAWQPPAYNPQPYPQYGQQPMAPGYPPAQPYGAPTDYNPAAYGQPDHYARRVILPLSSDNGGVHTNSGIPNQVYYLAIEGGTNRTSGLSVQGVGVSNREQIEKTMYRAFTQMMPADATFAVARTVTIQAATNLYGASSAATRAITQAWTAVGVN